ncbi:MAG: sigma-70 family RNA polymerase sigma factor [Thermaerobacterales bacterium]
MSLPLGENELWRRLRAGDGGARDDLIEHHRPLVYHLARRLSAGAAGYGHDDDDIVQVGMIGLIKAVDRFEFDRGFRFSTYAVPVILGEMKRYLRDQRPVKITRSGQALAKQAREMMRQLTQQWGREPAMHEIADELNVEVSDVLASLEATRQPLSVFSTGEGDDQTPLLDRLAGDDHGIEAGLHRIYLDQLLACLSARERRILLLRHVSGCTQQEIASLTGISQAQVSRIEKQALERLRSRSDTPPNSQAPPARPS